MWHKERAINDAQRDILKDEVMRSGRCLRPC